MALNPDYIQMTPWWELHSDKDTGELLRSGYAIFTRDTARTTGKPVYKLTGSPPNYTYIVTGFETAEGYWRVDLNDQGAFDDILYGYPFDEDGATDLYFIQFYSMDDVFQFSREGQPNFIEQDLNPTQEVDINYIPNGQFLMHLDLPKTSNYDAGQVRSPITKCAFGGWTFERPAGSTARDFVTFKRFAAYTPTPDKSPRYEIEIECESPSAGDAYKDLRIKFADVNKFASDVNEFTFGITGKYALGGGISVDLILIKNYGTSGDTATETVLTTFAITATYQNFYHAFTFGVNTGKSIGPLNDDYVQLALRFPVDSIYDVVFTDAILTPGNITAPVFDDTTNRQFIYRSIFSNVTPAPDGSDLYLPMTLSPDGLIPDRSVLGTISAKGTYVVGIGELPCIGDSYETESYSADGIPYSRIQPLLTQSLTTPAVPIPFNVPYFGTGLPFLTADILDTFDLKISTNIKGSTATPTDGGTPTGFTFKNIHTGQLDVEALGFLSNDNNFLIISDKAGIVTAPAVGTVGVTFVQNINSAEARSVITATIGAIAAGQYFAFSTGNGSGAEGVVLVWFKLNGAGTVPSYPTATQTIEIDLYTGMTEKDEAKIISDSISGKQVSQITCLAGNVIPAGSYFILDTLTQSYYVWYEVDGGGTDPAPSGKIGIKVSISTSDTKNQVTGKTATAINSKYFATPDLRGLILRGVNGGSNVDLDAATRFAFNTVTTGDSLGTLQFSSNIGHTHAYYSLDVTTPIRAIFDTAAITNGNTETRGAEPLTSPIADEGTSESRPQNIYVNYVIKY